MTLWMKVSDDKYELPEAVADSVNELAEMLHISPMTIYGCINKLKHGKIKYTTYKRIEVDEN